MSFDLSLLDPITKAQLHAETAHHMRGGTYVLGGTTELSLNVTYNYSSRLYDFMPEGLRTLHGQTGAESLPLLRRAIGNLGDNVSDDYWEPTDGNIKRALLQLVALASLRPDGVWDVN